MIVVSVYAVPRNLIAYEDPALIAQFNSEFEFLVRINFAGLAIDRFRNNLVQVDTAAQGVISADTVVHEFGFFDRQGIATLGKGDVCQRAIHQHRVVHLGYHIEVIVVQTNF